MIGPTQHQKRYQSAHKRFLKASLESFFEHEFPKLFGPVMREKIAQEIVDLVNQQLPAREYLRPGQALWNAVSIRTRPDHPRCQLVPVILTLVDPSDVQALAQGIAKPQIVSKAVARLTQEAYQQGALLSMRDISLLLWRSNGEISRMRLAWEALNHQILPHVGSLQDFGSCVSHKSQIVRKVIVEKKDPLKVAQETRHSQRAVDRYLKDYHRVRTCFEQNSDLEFIARATGLRKDVIRQYLELIDET